MKVINVSCKDHGIIEAVEMDLKGKNLVVSGKTGAGKTTAISILWDMIIKRVNIKSGSKKEVLEAYLENDNGECLRCKRVNTAKGSKLVVIDESGEVLPSATVKKMLSDISKNPLSLFEKTGNERFEYLLKCSSVNTSDYNKLKIDRKMKAEDRIDQKRTVDIIKGRIGERPEECEKVDVSERQTELSDAQAQNRKREVSRIAIVDLLSSTDKDNDSLKELGEQIEDAKNSMVEISKSIALREKRISESEKWLDDTFDIDTELLQSEILSATDSNAKHRNFVDWTLKNEEYSIENNKWCNLDDDVKALDKDIKSMINNIDFPLDGVTVEDEKVLYNGVDYDMLGTSEQILVSASLTAQQIVSQKNSIHAIRIDRGESMDEETQAKVMKVCNDIGVQVFISVVDRTSKDANFKVEIVEG